ncbi:MAG: four helix bundle protein [Phycisphaerales bacterium]|nr:four helix bundle protein [Phycisphaerales bacterium]
MSPIKSFRDLVAWQKAMALVYDTYQMTKRLPEDEQFGLVAQMRRCAVSIPSNIAEGQGRDTASDFLRFLHMARGSAQELSTQAELCGRLGLGQASENLIASCEEVGRILNGLIASLHHPAHAVELTTENRQLTTDN